MILNELSFVASFTTHEEIKRQFSVFLSLCHKLNGQKKDNVFCYTKELLTEPLCEGYTVYDWLNDSTVEPKEKQLFRSFLNRGYLIDKLQFLDSELLVDINGNKVAAIGCLTAYEWDDFVVSFLSDILWEKEYIDGHYDNLEDGESDVKVRNFSKEEHVDKLIAIQRQTSEILVSSGRELWSKRKELFPHLIFCESVKKQLEEARISLQIQSVKSRIQILEDYFATYEGRFEPKRVAHRCRNESESLKNHEKLKNMRKFVTPYGNEEYFFWHVSFVGNNRIHFLPDSQHKIGIIGYVGKHLPTPKYPTT